MKNTLPLYIFIKDVQRIHGLSYSNAKKKLGLVRRQLNKPTRALVLRREYCSVMKLTDEDLFPFYN